MTRPPAAEAVLLRRAAVRLGLQAALLASAIVVLLSTTAVVVVFGSQARAAETLLAAAASRADDVVDPPAGIWLVMKGPGGTTATAGMPAGLADPAALDRVAAGQQAAPEQRELGGVEYRIDTIRQPGGTAVQAVLDLTANHVERNRLATTMLLAGGAGLVLAAGVGTWLGNRALRPLSAALRLQRRFVADAGHELRTPVTLLHTRAQLLRRRLRRGAAGPAVLADVDGLVSDTARLGEVLEDLLLVADPLGSRPRQPVDLVELAREVLAAARSTAGERDVRLCGPPEGTAPVVVTGAPVALRRALTALVDNAVRHARHRVTVAVDQQGGQAHLDVLDDGTGIDPDLAPRLFHRFVSGRPTAAGGRRRYGLGLALVSEIAAAHGGRVVLIDHPDPGAALRLQLPLR